ncbi:DUF3000 domain-containing protein [Streptomyces sp. KR80]|uniref:DUF3000 domain-containing protein n=1 Tax=Streptomyces sp. KR80 TaxID=3457426 RepID=UPI003FCFCAAB
MAGAQERLSDGAAGSDGTEGSSAPLPFRQAVEALRSARLRPEMEIEPARAPQRLAPFAYALEAVVVQEEQDLADGRLVLLHDPAGHDAWKGTFRLVTLVRAETEPEMAADPLLPEVCWSWLIGALEARGAAYREPSGTVTLAGSHYFGSLANRAPATQNEIRASWTPLPGPDGVPDTAAHLAAWCELLCQIGGLPPVGSDPAVFSLPRRRGPRPR